ncbi:MAG: HEAT repeat domain-containing protein [Methanocalculus sp.]|uniref:HEAT repeat domain-containing protein n=1 Tax=Methanocalculus sp. TaxID=2004547 RepID=UPI0027247BBF|nr:HEAT repeat domain-containing protein [Methanocalculus sp.]MDO9539388.1 HEAT repeat domain-containing protein [Methanocalculus sp.]
MVLGGFFGPNIQNLAKRHKYEAIASLITTGDSSIKIEAVSTLAGVGEEAFELLATGLSGIRSSADRALLVREVYIKLMNKPELLIRFILASPENVRDEMNRHIISEGVPDLATLFTLSKSEDPIIRRAALVTADSLGKEGFDIVLSGLFDRDSEVAKESAGIFERRKAVPESPREKAQYLFVREKWIELVQMGKAGRPVLLKSLKDGTPSLRRTIIKALGKSRDPTLIEILKNHLCDPDPQVIGESVSAIAEIGGPEAEETLVNCLRASYPLVRMEASWGLKRLGWEAKNDQQKVMMLLAREDWIGLSRIGTPAIPALISALREEHSAVRSGATETLRVIGKSGIAALHKASESGDGTLAAAARSALAQINRMNQDQQIQVPKPRGDDQYRKEMNASLKARESLVQTLRKKAPSMPAGRGISIHKPKDQKITKGLYEEEMKASLQARKDYLAQGIPQKPLPVLPDPDIHSDTRETLKENETIFKSLNEVLRCLYGEREIRPYVSEDIEPEIKKKSDEEVLLAESGVIAAPPLPPSPDPRKKDDGEEEAPKKKDGLASLIASLSDRDANIRASACYALRLYGEPAVDPLIRCFHDTVPFVRAAAAEALGEIADIRAQHPLIELTNDDEPDVQVAAVAALGHFPDVTIIATLILLLVHDNYRVQKAAIDALIRVGSTALPALTHALDAPSLQVRINAVTALGRMEDPVIIPILIQYLDDENEEMRQTIARSLSRFGLAAIPPLSEILRQGTRLQKMTALDTFGRMSEDEATGAIRPALGDPDQGVRLYALRMIRKREALELWRKAWVEQIGVAVPKPKGIPRLKKEDEKLYVESDGENEIKKLINGLKESNRNVQFASAMKLTVMGKPAIVELLNAIKTESPEIRALAEEVIGEMRDVAVDPLTEALYDESPVIRAVAARNLGRIGAKKTIDSLMRAIETEENEDVRAIIVESLGYIGTQEVIPTLRRALRDRDDNVRSVAARALGYINDPEAVNALISGLDDNDIRVQEAALAALKDPDGTPQAHLVRAMILGGGGGNKNISSALSTLGWTPSTKEEEVCFLIAQNRWFEIERIGSDAIEPIRATLTNGSVEVRIEAIKALSRINGKDAIDALIHALSDVDMMVRKKAEYALVEVGEAAVNPLTQLTEDGTHPQDQTMKKILMRIRSRSNKVT